MDPLDPQAEEIDAILSDPAGFRRIAVVGISDRPERASHEVASYLLHQGFEVLPVNPRLGSVLGRACSADLAALAGRIDLVDVFRRPEEAGAVVDQAIAAGARAVWLQEGVVDEAAASRARAAGLRVVMDRCILKEHLKRRGGAHGRDDVP